jgi:hypothetical protein
MLTIIDIVVSMQITQLLCHNPAGGLSSATFVSRMVAVAARQCDQISKTFQRDARVCAMFTSRVCTATPVLANSPFSRNPRLLVPTSDYLTRYLRYRLLESNKISRVRFLPLLSFNYQGHR